MYLKKIETQGFKSFANRAVLEFTPGIMGIVGPNGSGKSNVADAVRWVLGEQSARQLRGSNMQDVIFAGTENRKPMSYAFVSLTIDNSDRSLPVETDEVTVSRQVFRSGESEYRINGNLCRLRDVYETFYDSGIGKEGYSIIGQGQIDLVLSNKPEERRLMFDEAAGITRYKKRRDITAKKLDAERASRERVEDILGELEKQVGPLEKQSAKARTYLKLRDELKEYEIGSFALEAGELEEKLERARSNLDAVTADRDTAASEAERLRDQYESVADANEALDKTQAARQAQLADLRVANENREGRISLLEEQIRAAESNTDLVNERLRDYDGTDARLKEEREAYYAEKSEIDREQDKADDGISRLEEESESVSEERRDLEYQIDKGNEALMSSLTRRSEISGTIAALTSKEEQLAARLAELTEEKEKAGKEEDRLSLETEALRRAAEGLSEQVSAREAALAEKKKQQTAEETEARRLETETHRLERERSVLKSRRESLLNLIERYDGYGGAVKSVMEHREELGGICGVVADLISSEKQYETAIETVLGSRLQNIVTDSEEDAKAAIEFLKRNRLGRATFLPLDAVRGDRQIARPEALREKGVLGTAASLVKFEARYGKIADFLLGAVIVTDQMDHALAIARKYQHRLSIVTLDGEYLTPGGVMSGGAFRNSSNLLGRRRELAECEEKEAEANRLAASYEAKLHKIRKESEARNKQLEDEDRKLRADSLRLAALTAQQEARMAELQRAEKLSAALEADFTRVRREKEEAAAQRGLIGRDAESLEEGNDQLREQVMELVVQLDRIKEKEAEISSKLEDQRVKFANLVQKNDFYLENIRRINREIERNQAEKEELLRGRTSVEEVVKEREDEILLLKQETEDVRQTIAALEEAIRTDSERREQGREQQQSYFEARESVQARLAELDKESFRLTNLTEKYEEQIEKQAEYLWAEYEMTPSQAMATRNESIVNPAEARRMITQKKREIKELGPVYVDAIEKYKEVSERYEFLKAQQEDLVKAEEELTGLIHDLEKGMRDQFREQFALIQNEFSRVFGELFAGGKGTLTLENEEDVLSSGVIINAQPPGKKLQNMMQLSGGEKALTAIALLFAIQNLKPSPFCLLDEIESALDEPNVKRFADYLFRLRGSTQFLIITHRRGTMEMADRLYGITMQEKGVSALVSVNLTDPASREILDEEE